MLYVCQDCRQHTATIQCCFSRYNLSKWKEWVSVVQSKNNTINTYFMCVPVSVSCRWGFWIVGVFSTQIPGCPIHCLTCALVLIGSINIHSEVQTCPFRGLGQFSLLAPLQRLLPSSSFGRLLKLSWERARDTLLLRSQVCFQMLNGGVLPSWVPGTGNAAAMVPRAMLMHYKLFPIGGVICLMLCGGSSRLQVNLVGVASLRAIWQTHFKTSFWHNKKKIVFSIQTAEENFPVKGSYEDSGIATGLINGGLKQYFSCF